jgi:hypothetical protein
MKDVTVPNKDTLLVFDADIILYSKGFKHESTEEWWVVESDINKWIEDFFEKFGTTNYVLYLTGKGNFRETVAVSHVYKGGRTKAKPKWYNEIKQYLFHCHNTGVAEGMEADDLIAMALTSNPNSIHIGIDKDLLQVEGWHYRYATHNSPEVPLRWISNEGYLELQVTETKAGKKKNKLVGGGYKWFYAQCLLGDKCDEIHGVSGYGDVKTYETLVECETESECLDAVKSIYLDNFGEKGIPRLLENADLLWMVRGYNDKGGLDLWSEKNLHRIG